MEWIGKGLGTIGIWGGVAFITSSLANSGFGFILIFIAIVFAFCGTVAIWSPENIKNIIDSL